MERLKPIWVLAAHSLHRRYRSLLVWGVVLGALGALYVALYPTMSRFIEKALEQAPESMRGFMDGFEGGMSITQYMDTQYLISVVAVALPFLAIILGARTIAGAEERKTLDLLLSNPVPRWQVLAGASATMGISLAGILALGWLLTYISVVITGADLGAGASAAGFASLWPFCMLFGALALLMSSFMRRGGFAIAIPGFILVMMYVISSLVEISTSIRPLRFISLFYYLGGPLHTGFPWAGIMGMLGGIVVLSALAAAVFHRRDVFT